MVAHLCEAGPGPSRNGEIPPFLGAQQGDEDRFVSWLCGRRGVLPHREKALGSGLLSPTGKRSLYYGSWWVCVMSPSLS